MTRLRSLYDRTALRVAVAYLLVAAIWILVSDRAVEQVSWLASDPTEFAAGLQRVKGLFFVAVTGLGLYATLLIMFSQRHRLEREKEQIEEALRISQRLETLGSLAAMVAHDFNNVLTIIRGMATLAAHENYDPQRMPGRLQEIDRAAVQADQVVKRLMLFMRNTTNVTERQDIGAVVKEFEPLLQQAVGRHTTLVLSIAGGLPLVALDRAQVEQALLNLAVNAHDAMERMEERELKIAVTLRRLRAHRSVFLSEPATGLFVVVSVGDTGCGIPPENVVKVFTPFFTTKPVGRGTGLGLASVLRVLQQHRGWVEVDSAPDKGARFDLFFPVPEADGA